MVHAQHQHSRDWGRSQGQPGLYKGYQTRARATMVSPCLKKTNTHYNPLCIVFAYRIIIILIFMHICAIKIINFKIAGQEKCEILIQFFHSQKAKQMQFFRKTVPGVPFKPKKDSFCPLIVQCGSSRC